MFIIKTEERVVSLFIVHKAYSVLNCNDNFKCLNINSGTPPGVIIIEGTK